MPREKTRALGFCGLCLCLDSGGLLVGIRTGLLGAAKLHHESQEPRQTRATASTEHLAWKLSLGWRSTTYRGTLQSWLYDAGPLL